MTNSMSMSYWMWGGSGTVICILTTIYMHVSRFMCSVHT